MCVTTLVYVILNGCLTDYVATFLTYVSKYYLAYVALLVFFCLVSCQVLRESDIASCAMPTSSSHRTLVGSRYTVTPPAYVDVRRFHFFRERQFDIRDDLNTEKLSKAQRAVATPRPPELLLSASFPLPPASAISPPIQPQGPPPLFSPLPSAPLATPNHQATQRLLLTSSSGSFDHRTSNRAAVSNPRHATLSSCGTALKPLYNMEGDTIWTAGRSLAIEACDRSQLHYDLQQREAALAEEDTNAMEKSIAVAPPTGPLASHNRRVSDQQDRRVSLLLGTSINDMPAEISSAAATPCGSTPSDRSVLQVSALDRQHHVAVASVYHQRAVPRSPRIATAPDHSSERLPTSESFTERRRSSVRSRNARLAKQLEKQSKRLHDRISALNAGESLHRDEITKLGGRMLAGLGCVDEMEEFIQDPPPLPDGCRYVNMHSLDLVSEVPLDDVGGPGSSDDRSRQVNQEVRWMALLKKDVGQTALQEEATRRSQKNFQTNSAGVANPRGGRGPQPPSAGHQTRPHGGLTLSAGQPSSSTRSLSACHESALSPHLTIDDIAALADARVTSELAGRHATGMQQAHKYSEAVEAKEEKENETIRTILSSDAPGQDQPTGRRRPKKGETSSFTERAHAKRNAVVDTTALEARLARGNTDMTILGAQAVVDLTLFRKDASLFSLTGEDTDPTRYPSFPFIKGEVNTPRDDGFGVSFFDNKKVVEEKTFASERYHQQNLSDRLERTHILRRMLGDVFNRKGATGSASAPHGSAKDVAKQPAQGSTNEKPKPREDDEDVVAAREDWQRWKRAAGAMPSEFQRGDAHDRIRKEQVYTWHQVSKDHNVGDMPRL